MSSAFIESKKAPTTPSLMERDPVGGNTFQGRLELAQSIFAKILKARFGDKHVDIMDVGIGDGAITVIHDLPKALKEAGIQSATIIGVDLIKFRVEAARALYGKAQKRGAIPDGINICFERGDIEATDGNPMQLSAIVERLKQEGVISGVDLITSFNLLPDINDATRTSSAIREMAKVLNKDGIGFIGSGETERRVPSSVSFKIFNHPELDKQALIRMDLEFQKNLARLSPVEQEKRLDQIAQRIQKSI